MIRQIYKKHVFYSVVVAVLTAVLLSMPDSIVRSQGTIESRPSPFQFERPLFGRLPEPKKDVPEMIFGPGAGSAGGLDPTFGTDGKLTPDFGSSESGGAVALQPDGKIVVAGTVLAGPSDSASNNDFAVFRYNEDGSLDISFGGDGKVTTPIGTGYDAAYAIAIQADGKIVAAGSGSGSAALVRYNPDGSLDQSFGVGGKVTTAANSRIYEIAIQADGKIVAAGGNFSFTVARYNTDGSLDASFGTGGMVSTDFGNVEQGVNSVALQADGKIVAAGYAAYCDEKYCYPDFALARYNPDGSPDVSFDSDGRLTTAFEGSNSFANAVALQSDGKIVATGHAYAVGFAVSRYNPDGSLDTSFDSDGRVTPTIDGGGVASSAALQMDGKVVLSGWTYAFAGRDFVLMRLNTNGSLDTSFDSDGALTTDFSDGDDHPADVAIQTNGRIVAAGASTTGTADLAISRYNADGALDAAFGDNGKVTTSVIDVSAVASAAVNVQNNGVLFAGYANSGLSDDFAVYGLNGAKRITPIGNLDDRANAAAAYPSPINYLVVVAGYSHNGSNTDFALVRYGYSSNIGIDSSFGQNGKVLTDFNGSNDSATAVAIYPDNWFVVAGHTNSGTALALARYHPGGSLDPSFGSGGKVVVPGIQNVKAIAIQPGDGKILVAGSAPHTEPPFGDNFALARFHPNGSLDTTFDGDGIAVTRFGLSSRINSIAIQRNGRIVAAGSAAIIDTSATQFALARYNANGTLDTSFDGDGKVTTALGGITWANAVRVQRNNKIIAVGSSVNYKFTEFALARYSPDGSLDTTFDTDGIQTTDFFGGDDLAFAATIQINGNIIAAGSADRDGRTYLAAARYVGDANGAPARFDYDGDGRTDYSVFRPSTGFWYVQNTSGSFQGMQFGVADDKLAPADYDGDGKADIAVYRPSTGVWYVVNSSDLTFSARTFGTAEDMPTPADYDGDGKADISVFRPSQGTWYRQNSSDGSYFGYQFGQNGDIPTIGDFDSDGLSDIGIYRTSTNDWYNIRSADGSLFHERFGQAGDRIVPADYDDDGRTDIAIYRPSEGFWVWRNSSNATYSYRTLGGPNDIPIPGDYDGDGKTDVGVWRPSDGVWDILRSSDSRSIIFPWGLTGDRPTPASFGN